LGCALAACSAGHDLSDSDARDADRARDRPREHADDDERANDDDGDQGDDGDETDPGDAPDEGANAAGAAAEDPDPGSPLFYHRDVKPILDAKCTQCHFDGGIAPFPLTQYSEVTPYLNLIRADVDAAVMPPWRAVGPLDVFEGDRRLTDAQKQTVVRWIDQGAPEGDPDDAPPPLEPVARGLSRVDVSLQIPEAYTPEIEPDDYRCFVFEWPHQDTRYITGLSIEPDRTESVHHAIVYLVQPENADASRQQDANDPGPGYTCFGATGGLATWLTSYEPGGYGQEVPGHLGFEVRPGSLIVLQVHYNTLNGVHADRSRVDFTVEQSVPRVGRVVLLMNPTWPAGNMPIAQNAADVVHTYRGRPSQLAADKSYDIQWVDLHMHQLGSRGGIGIARASNPNTVEPLLQILDWAFEWQETYNFRQPVKLLPGDQLVVECHWDNTASNQTVVGGQRLQPRAVNWGEGTTDEMCLGNVLVAESQ
jgi:hypothetical protein